MIVTSGGVYYLLRVYISVTKTKTSRVSFLDCWNSSEGLLLKLWNPAATANVTYNSRSFESDHLILWSWLRIEHLLDIWLLRGKLSSFFFLIFQYPIYLLYPNIIFRLRPGEGKWQWRPWWRGVKLALKLKTGGSSRFPQSIFRIFRVFRIVKIFRVFRIFRILREYMVDTKILTINIKLKTAGESRPHAQYIQN